MKFNPVAAHVKAALMIDNLERVAVGQVHTFGAPPPVVNEAAPVAEKAWDRVAREASLALPLKQAQRDLAKALQADLDEALRIAIERHLGVPLTDPETQVRGRLTSHPDPVDPLDPMQRAPGGETYAMDGRAILWAGPVKSERYGDVGDEHVRATRQLRHLLPEKAT